MYWLADRPHFWQLRALGALGAMALAHGCTASGDQVLGSIRQEPGPIRADAAPRGPDASGPCISGTSYPGHEIGQDLAIYFTIDRSAQSMLDPTGDKWDELVSGLTSYLHSNAANGISIGIDYFPASGPDGCSRCPPRDCGCLAACGCPCDQHGNPRNCQRGGWCESSSYRAPDVEIDPMPQNGSALAGSLFAQIPFGPTTIRPALRGALDYTAAYAATNPRERVIEVLIAGGPPFECGPASVSDCAEVAASSNTRTYVVEYDYSGPSLEPIAIRGGGKRFQFESRDRDIERRFAELVAELRDRPHCEYDLPSTSDFDLGRINVEFTVAAGAGSGVPTTLFQVDGREACNGGPGWYYDRPDRPTRIVMCEDTCRRIHGPTEASVNIKIGCPTVPPPP
jgi:hypothetical protein